MLYDITTLVIGNLLHIVELVLHPYVKDNLFSFVGRIWSAALCDLYILLVSLNSNSAIPAGTPNLGAEIDKKHPCYPYSCFSIAIQC